MSVFLWRFMCWRCVNPLDEVLVFHLTRRTWMPMVGKSTSQRANRSTSWLSDKSDKIGRKQNTYLIHLNPINTNYLGVKIGFKGFNRCSFFPYQRDGSSGVFSMGWYLGIETSQRHVPTLWCDLHPRHRRCRMVLRINHCICCAKGGGGEGCKKRKLLPLGKQLQTLLLIA